jgi:hypothetical protein
MIDPSEYYHSESYVVLSERFSAKSDGWVRFRYELIWDWDFTAIDQVGPSGQGYFGWGDLELREAPFLSQGETALVDFLGDKTDNAGSQTDRISVYSEVVAGTRYRISSGAMLWISGATGSAAFMLDALLTFETSPGLKLSFDDPAFLSQQAPQPVPVPAPAGLLIMAVAALGLSRLRRYRRLDRAPA